MARHVSIPNIKTEPMARILAVEDEVDLCDLLREELEAEGHEVETANDGDEALRVLQSFVPEIIISDVSMPGLDGFGLLEELRAKHPALADTPFLFLTALKNREDELRARECGVDDYLTKPIDFDMLHSVLATRLRQVSRMHKRKEQQMVKLYKALAPDGGLPPALALAEHDAAQEGPCLGELPEFDVPDEAASENPDGGATPEPRGVFGSLFAFPNLKRITGSVPGVGERLRKRTIGRAVEIVTGLVCDESVVSTVDDDKLFVSYRDAHEAQAKELSDSVGNRLRQKLLEDRGEEWKAEFGLDDETIAKALIVSEALFEITLSPDDGTSEQFEQSVLEAIENTRINSRAPTLLMASIRRDNGTLTPLKMVSRDGEQLPIRFFSYDDRTKQKLRAGFTFFGNDNRDKASYLVDVMTLELMEQTDTELGKSDIAVVDVHYRTLASRIYAPSYVRKFLRFAKDAPYSFMPNVRSVPSKITDDELNEMFRPLGKYASRRALQVRPLDVSEAVKSKLPVSCLVCPYPELSATPESAASFRELRPALAKAGTLLVVRGLESEDDIKKLKEFGVDGYAIDELPASRSDKI